MCRSAGLGSLQPSEFLPANLQALLEVLDGFLDLLELRVADQALGPRKDSLFELM